MNYKSLTTLEYNKIIDKLVSFAASEPAKSRLKKLVPMNDINDINYALAQTNDALRRIHAGLAERSSRTETAGKISRTQILAALVCCIADFLIAQFGLLTLIQKVYSILAYLAIPVILVPYVVHMAVMRFDTKK